MNIMLNVPATQYNALSRMAWKNKYNTKEFSEAL